MRAILIIVISTIFILPLATADGFDRKECQWESRNLRTMALRLKNISWDIERRCRQSSSKGKKICAEYISYFDELLGKMNKQHLVAKDRCIK
ncbi:MAG: hypothetical protein DRQ88_04245 [Epsilonproteobacteria bacterium]|nr:MAG: hypothetical protein DRQ88_04245 [Campylobacterota bacterium]